MNISFEKIPSQRIVYIRHVGPYGSGNVQTMEKIKNWARCNKLFNDDSIIYGITHDNPDTTKPENCRYDTCIAVSRDSYIDEGYVSQGQIVGGNYVVFKIIHTAEEVQKAWIEIFPELSKQGYQFDDTRPILERYRIEMVKNHFCEICIPIL